MAVGCCSHMLPSLYGHFLVCEAGWGRKREIAERYSCSQSFRISLCCRWRYCNRQQHTAAAGFHLILCFFVALFYFLWASLLFCVQNLHYFCISLLFCYFVSSFSLLAPIHLHTLTLSIHIRDKKRTCWCFSLHSSNCFWFSFNWN